jgi:hypothetical protein
VAQTIKVNAVSLKKRRLAWDGIECIGHCERTLNSRINDERMALAAQPLIEGIQGGERGQYNDFVAESGQSVEGIR